MRHFLITVGILFGLMSGLSAQSWAGETTAASSGLTLQSETAKDTKAAAAWTETTINTGKINQGEPVTVTYSFTNTGDAPLTIEHVKPSCGCTAADYSKEAIAPGESGFVKATYNAKAAGMFNKVITVRSNAGIERLILQGEVIATE